jgi:hypothetical protein
MECVSAYGVIIVTGHMTVECICTDGSTAKTAGIVSERLIASSRIITTAIIAKERIDTSGGVTANGGVVEKRSNSYRGIVDAAAIIIECLQTERRIPCAIRKAKKRPISFSGVPIGIASIRGWADRSRFKGKRAVNKDAQEDKKTPSIGQPNH